MVKEIDRNVNRDQRISQQKDNWRGREKIRPCMQGENLALNLL